MRSNSDRVVLTHARPSIVWRKSLSIASGEHRTSIRVRGAHFAVPQSETPRGDLEMHKRSGQLPVRESKGQKKVTSSGPLCLPTPNSKKVNGQSPLRSGVSPTTM